MELNLNPPERDLLEGLLRQTLATLREEVYHADEARFKDELKAEETIIRGLLRKLPAPTALAS
jgi:hypothetical protein